jgi:hypothetical protein
MKHADRYAAHLDAVQCSWTLCANSLYIQPSSTEDSTIYPSILYPQLSICGNHTSSGESGDELYPDSYADFQFPGRQGLIPTLHLIQAVNLECEMKNMASTHQHDSSDSSKPAMQTVVDRPIETLVITVNDLAPIDEVFQYHFGKLSNGGKRLSFIHFQHMQPACRSDVLNNLSGLAQLYVLSTPESVSDVLDLVSFEVQRLYSQVRPDSAWLPTISLKLT